MTPARNAQGTIRYDALDGMRGVAAIAVMLYHYTMYSSPSLFQHAHVAVDIFFILSGFVIAHSYGKRLTDRSMNSAEYLMRRIIRLYPMFLIGLLLGVLVFYMYHRAGLSDFTTNEITNALLYNTFFIPSLSRKATYDFGSIEVLLPQIFPINPPAWSLFFELLASIAFIFVVNFRQKTLFVALLISYVIMIINGILVSVANNRLGIELDQGWAPDNMLGGCLRVFFGFFLGVFIYRISRGDRLHTWKELCQRYFSNITYIYIILILVFIFPKSFKGLYEAFILICIAPALVFSGSTIDIGHGFTKKMAIYLGWISYPVYCLHYPIGRLVFLLMDGARGGSYYMNLLPALLSSVLTLAIAAAFAKYLDEPIRRYLTKTLCSPALVTRRG